MVKKILAMLLAAGAVFACGLCACEEDNSQSGGASTPTESTGDETTGAETTETDTSVSGKTYLFSSYVFTFAEDVTEETKAEYDDVKTVIEATNEGATITFNADGTAGFTYPNVADEDNIYIGATITYVQQDGTVTASVTLSEANGSMQNTYVYTLDGTTLSLAQEYETGVTCTVYYVLQTD